MSEFATEIQQGSDEWLQLRLGSVTASQISAVMAKGEGKTREAYMSRLVSERLTGEPHRGFKNKATDHGTETEPEARAYYELQTRELITAVAYVKHPRIHMCGASPDGLVGSDGLVEAKCPESHTHIANLRGAKIDGKYVYQMQWQMECTGRTWCDFISYDPGMPEGLKLKVTRVRRDDVMIATITRGVTLFLEELDELERELRSMQRAA